MQQKIEGLKFLINYLNVFSPGDIDIEFLVKNTRENFPGIDAGPDSETQQLLDNIINQSKMNASQQNTL